MVKLSKHAQNEQAETPINRTEPFALSHKTDANAEWINKKCILSKSDDPNIKFKSLPNRCSLKKVVK